MGDEHVDDPIRFFYFNNPQRGTPIPPPPNILSHICSLESSLNNCSTNNQSTYSSSLQNSSHALFIAVSATIPISYVLTKHAGGSCHILTVGTSPAFQRQKLARTLLLHALNFAKTSKKCNTATLHVSKTNVAARALYTSLDFSTADTVTDYYPDHTTALQLLLDPITPSKEIMSLTRLE